MTTYPECFECGDTIRPKRTDTKTLAGEHITRYFCTEGKSPTCYESRYLPEGDRWITDEEFQDYMDKKFPERRR